jgi:hypothetical protein
MKPNTKNGAASKPPAYEGQWIPCEVLREAIRDAVKRGVLEGVNVDRFGLALERAGAILSVDADREFKEAPQDPNDDAEVPQAVHDVASLKERKSYAHALTSIGQAMGDAVSRSNR